MSKEIWKDIEGYKGLYQISNFGRIKTKDNIIKKCVYTKDGYLRTSLYKNKTRRAFLVHRLVAQAFIPNKLNKKEVNHINAIKDDNRVENLEWVTSKENNVHSIKMGLQKRLSGKQHPNSKIVYQYDLEGNFIRQWDCVSQAAKCYGVSNSCIQDCCREIQRTCKGFIWKYKSIEVIDV